MDPNKAYEIGRQGDEQRFRSLIQDALSEGNEAIVSWLLDKLKVAHAGSFKDIIEEAVTNANTESETYKPTDLAKKYWNEYFPEAEQQNLSEDDGPNEDSKNLAADIQSKLNKAATEEKINMASGAEPTPTPRPLSSDDEWGDDNDKKHEGFEQQAEGLDNLLEGLRDTPHDNRW